MSEWTKVEHREECEIRPAESGEVVSTLAGPQPTSEGGFVLRRRLVPLPVVEAEDDELRAQYMQRYSQAAPEDLSRDALYTALGFGWEERPCDADYAEWHFRTEDLEFETDSESLEPPYDGYTNDVLWGEIERRNGLLTEDAPEELVITPEEPQRKAELVAALEADDARSSDQE